MAREGRGHIGMRLLEGSVEAGSSIVLNGLTASAKASLF